jgi:tellurite methyltransferase
VPRNWEERYRDPSALDFTPTPLLVQVAGLLKPGRALDLACGPGRHALHLARLGWDVVAVDSSPKAIAILRSRAGGLAIDARVADLEAGEFLIPPAGFDLICDFFYLQRDLFPRIREGLRPGGVFTGAIHLAVDTPGAPPRNPAFLLQPGELRSQFAEWKVLYYSESAQPSRPAAWIIARKA